MGVIGSQTLNGFTYTEAYARMGAIPQPDKGKGSARLYLDLHASKAAYAAIAGTAERGLCPRWLQVDIYTALPPGRAAGLQPGLNPGGSRHVIVVTPDVVRMWGVEPQNPHIAGNLWPDDAFAQGWAMIEGIAELSGMASDEA